MKFVKQYPAVIAGAVQAVLGLVVAFGVHLTADQVASVLAVTGALLALVVHTQVTPTSNAAAPPPAAAGVGGPPVIDPSASPPPT